MMQGKRWEFVKKQGLASCFHRNDEDRRLHLEKIPAYVCSQCGERYFEEQEVDAIQDMIKTFEEKLKGVLTAT